jgi:hypothetical protein
MSFDNYYYGQLAIVIEEYCKNKMKLHKKRVSNENKQNHNTITQSLFLLLKIIIIA